MPLARQTFRRLFAPSGSKRRKALGSGNENLDYFGQTRRVRAVAGGCGRRRSARNSRVSRSTHGQPQHGAAEVIVLGEIAIDCNTVDLVVADDRLTELITSMRNVGNPAS